MMCMTWFVQSKVYERVSMHYIFNHRWIVEVLLALPGVVLVMVSVLLGVLGEVMVHVVTPELSVVGWGRGKRWDTSYTAQTHTHGN